MCILYIMYSHIEKYVAFIVICLADSRVGFVLDQRGRRYYICHMFSVIHDASIGHERWVDAGLILSQRRRLWSGNELALTRRLCFR